MKKLVAFTICIAFCAAMFLSISSHAQNPNKPDKSAGQSNASPKNKAKFRHAAADKVIPGEYIVVLNDDVADVDKLPAILLPCTAEAIASINTIARSRAFPRR